MIDFKIQAVNESDTDTSVVVSFYKGAVTTEDEPTFDASTGQIVMQPVTRYRRTDLIKTRTLPLSSKFGFRTSARARLLKQRLHDDLQTEAQNQGETPSTDE